MNQSELLEQTMKILSRLDSVQREAVDLAMSNLRLGIGDDVGTGKTVMSCAIMAMARPSRVLVICQTGPLTDSWEKHIAEWAPGYKTYTTDKLGRDEKVYTRPGESDFVVITTPGRVASDLKSIVKGKYDMVIVDEAHFLASRTSKQSKAVTSLLYTHIPKARVLLLSATFIKNSVADMYLPLKIVNATTEEGKEAHKSFHEWSSRYVESVTTQSGPFSKTEYKGFYNSPYVDEYLDKFFRPLFLFRRVESNYTNLEINIVEVEMYTAQREYYNQVKTQMLVELGGKVLDNVHVMSQVQRFRQICISPQIFEDDALFMVGAKIDKAVEIIHDTEPDEKVVIFTSFARAAEKMLFTLAKDNITALVVTGKLNGNSRTETIEMFKNDPKFKVLVITGATGGAGLNLQVANVAIMLDLPWTGASLKQQIGRTNRRGQTKDVRVYLLECINSVDSKFRALCYEKLSSLNDLINLKSSLTSYIKLKGVAGLADLL